MRCRLDAQSSGSVTRVAGRFLCERVVRVCASSRHLAGDACRRRSADQGATPAASSVAASSGMPAGRTATSASATRLSATTKPHATGTPAASAAAPRASGAIRIAVPEASVSSCPGEGQAPGRGGQRRGDAERIEAGDTETGEEQRRPRHRRHGRDPRDRRAGARQHDADRRRPPDVAAGPESQALPETADEHAAEEQPAERGSRPRSSRPVCRSTRVAPQKTIENSTAMTETRNAQASQNAHRQPGLIARPGRAHEARTGAQVESDDDEQTEGRQRDRDPTAGHCPRRWRARPGRRKPTPSPRRSRERRAAGRAARRDDRAARSHSRAASRRRARPAALHPGSPRAPARQRGR